MSPHLRPFRPSFVWLPDVTYSRRKKMRGNGNSGLNKLMNGRNNDGSNSNSSSNGGGGGINLADVLPPPPNHPPPSDGVEGGGGGGGVDSPRERETGTPHSSYGQGGSHSSHSFKALGIDPPLGKGPMRGLEVWVSEKL